MIVASGQGGSKELSCKIAGERNGETHTFFYYQVGRQHTVGGHSSRNRQEGNGGVKKNLRHHCMLGWNIS